MQSSESIKAIAPAILKAQCHIKDAEKNAENPHLRSKYADLGSVMDACKAALNEQGISILQCPVPSESGTLQLETVLLHESGEWVSSILTMPLPKADPQGFGSAMTYARRYGLSAIVGVCPEDDDGEAAKAGKAAPRSGQNRSAAAATETGPVSRLNMSGAQCASCHAPHGKAHTPKCEVAA